MSRIIIIAIVLFFTFTKVNGQQHRAIGGDVYFVLKDFTRFFDTPDSLRESEERKINQYDSLHKGDPIVKFYRELKENGLLSIPRIAVIDEKDSVKLILVSSKDFDKLKMYNCWDLIGQGKKISIELNVKKLDIKQFTLYQATEPLTFKLVEGKTRHN
jgi:hypothetical protein